MKILSFTIKVHVYITKEHFVRNRIAQPEHLTKTVGVLIKTGTHIYCDKASLITHCAQGQHQGHCVVCICFRRTGRENMFFYFPLRRGGGLVACQQSVTLPELPQVQDKEHDPAHHKVLETSCLTGHPGSFCPIASYQGKQKSVLPLQCFN